jgi:hypothetical protein
MIAMTPAVPTMIVIGPIIIGIGGRIVVIASIIIIFIRAVGIVGVITPPVIAWFDVYAKTLLSFPYGGR